MLSRFFLNNSNKKMLTPNVVDIAVIISSLIASPCFTFANHLTTFFSLSSQVVHWSAEIQTKGLFTTQERSDRPTDKGSEFTLAYLTPISHSAK